MIKKDLVIIGGGSAGMSAAVAAYDAGVRDILILERNAMLGGILNQCIHNGFGLHEFKEELTGPEFLTRFADMVKERNIEYKLNSFVTNISKDKVVTYSNEIEGCVEVQARAIINACGCYERNAGAIGIPGDRPAGILTAGQAQLYLNEYGYLTGKKVFILGSGDIGLIMARRMTLEGAKVLGVAEIQPYSNGLNRNIQQCLLDFDIPLYLSHTVTRVFGKKKLEKIEISQVDSSFNPIPGTEKYFEVDNLLLSIGLLPNNVLFNSLGIPTGKSRGSVVNEKLETEIPGLFCCGNVLHVHDLVDYVVNEGRTAGLAASEYLSSSSNEEQIDYLDVVAGSNIGYVIPNKINPNSSFNDIELKFRVSNVFKDAYILIKQGDEILKKIYKQAIIPSEMEIYKLPRNLLKNNQQSISVSLVKKEDLVK